MRRGNVVSFSSRDYDSSQSPVWTNDYPPRIHLGSLALGLLISTGMWCLIGAAAYFFF